MYLFNDIVNESLKLIQIAKEKVQPHGLQMYDPNRQSPAGVEQVLMPACAISLDFEQDTGNLFNAAA